MRSRQRCKSGKMTKTKISIASAIVAPLAAMRLEAFERVAAQVQKYLAAAAKLDPRDLECAF